MSWSEPAFAAIAELLTPEYGLAFPPARRAFAEAAVRRAMTSVHERTPTEYLARIRAEPALLHALIAEITIGETYFFRDPLQFDVIRETVVPELLERHAAGETLRIWSAGCATGEEAYSLAMLAGECGITNRASLLATDVSSVAIEIARRASYGSWSFRRDAADWRARCFVRSGKRWTVAAAYRHVDFLVHNLMHAAPVATIAGGFDLIVCRNVLLYFDRKTLERAMHHLADALAPGGWLLMSPTDPPPSPDLGLETHVTSAGIVYRRLLVADPVALPAAAPAIATPQPSVAPAARVARAKRTSVPAEPAPDAETYVARALAFLDMSQPHQAALAARRALFLDRTLAIAHLTLARALRLTGSRIAAKRALERGSALLGTLPPEESVRGADGVSAGTLVAVAAAEFALLIGPHAQ